VDDLRPGPDEVGVIDVDLDLMEMSRAQAPHARLQIVGAGRCLARKCIDLADLTRFARSGG
jgi:hypothetical protein